MSTVQRVLVEKKYEFAEEAKKLLNDLKHNLHIGGLEALRVVNVYDLQGMDQEDFDSVKKLVLSEPNVDAVYDEEIDYGKDDVVFMVQYLPGQFDQRADSAGQCIEIITLKERPIIHSSKMYILSGDVTESDVEKIKNYLINPVESMEVSVLKPITLERTVEKPAEVATIEGFIAFSEEQMAQFKADMGFAMSQADILHIQNYFKSIDRNPTITELKVIDTYWSDHCRHTTFMTEITEIEFEHGTYADQIKASFEKYLATRKDVYKDRIKDINLMDMATINAKKERMAGNLEDLDISEEINACSINVKVDVDGKDEDYLVMFKNETHNHPTEIEPFGGASTCLGGAIRDPLSGRVYVYQGMRVTGSADPRTPFEETIPGKLPQKKITTEAAKGFSSYGNQIGLATGLVSEVYDEGFLAKRMEVGAVIGAAPKENVVRMKPESGDIILIVGGETGRDGCGGATGSSKEHDEESIMTCGAEVQKGNAPVERKLQRLFRNPELSVLIKRCNDFGAGGVSVAIGELADSIDVDLDKVPTKYAGLDGTELAISESQERMAVVIEEGDLDKFIALSKEENLNAVQVAQVTDSGRLRMMWRDQVIFDVERSFLDTNGVKGETKAAIKNPSSEENFFDKNHKSISGVDMKEDWLKNLSRLNVCSQKGLVENFDNTVGASNVHMPFGGKHARTPIQGMVSKIPVLKGETSTGTIMTYGYDPEVGKWSVYHGGMYSVLDSIARLVAIGGDYRAARLSMQEYFERLGDAPERWGKPVSGLLGAFEAMEQLKLGAIGGKDSMSGTFKDIHVPPTVISFAVAPVDVNKVVSPELKKADSELVMLTARRNDVEVPEFESLKKGYAFIHDMISEGKVLSSFAIGKGGIAGAVSKMAFGNGIGVAINDQLDFNDLFEEAYGSIILEIEKEALDLFMKEHPAAEYMIHIGRTTEAHQIAFGKMTLDIDEAVAQWEAPLKEIFPMKEDIEDKAKGVNYTKGSVASSKVKVDKPKVFIPVFPGTNSEIDTGRAFEKVGAEVQYVVLNNLSSEGIEKSVDEMVAVIKTSQIIAIPGGFSAGDEPDGSGKFIGAVFRNPKMRDAVMDLLNNRDGLMIGICNGFQALVKLGLLPYGEIRELDEVSPTLTYNKIGRHISKIVRTKISSNLSPWLSLAETGDVYNVAVSHGEGRFYCSEEMFDELAANGQIATQYVDENGLPTYEGAANPNGSLHAVEGITSPDGRIFGKMGHTERYGDNVYRNIPGDFDLKIFEAGVNYFKK